MKDKPPQPDSGLAWLQHLLQEQKDRLHVYALAGWDTAHIQATIRVLKAQIENAKTAERVSQQKS